MIPRAKAGMRFLKVALVIVAGGYIANCFAADTVSPSAVVSALEGQFGVTPGQRRNHINGVCVAGSFTGNKSAEAYSTSPLFSGKVIPVVGRFSLAGGSLKIPDTARNPRGLALEFKLPNNGIHHFTLLNVPIFGAATPQSFYEGVIAGAPNPETGKPDPEKVAEYKASHPDNQGLSEFLAKNNPISSYINSDYYGVHTFKFVNNKQKESLVRWRFVPQAGVSRLSDNELKASPARFLDQDIIDKLRIAPAKWDLVVTVGEDWDEQLNPTVYWPAGRREINAGVLTLTSATPQQGATCEKINFDPLVLSEGIIPTNDPVLQFRSPAYADSFAKRIHGK